MTQKGLIHRKTKQPTTQPYIYHTGSLALWVEFLPEAQETRVQFQVESYLRLKKCHSTPASLTLSIIRYGSRVKWSNQGKGVAPFLTLWCSSYWKGSLPVTPNLSHQLYFYICVYIYIYFSLTFSVCVCIYIYIYCTICIYIFIYISCYIYL